MHTLTAAAVQMVSGTRPETNIDRPPRAAQIGCSCPNIGR